MAKILGQSIKNIPWEDKPEGYKYPVWRYSANPIIHRDDVYMSNSIFNSAIIPFKGKFAGVFRVDMMSREQKLFVGFSDNGFDWTYDEKPIFSGYDPRMCEIDGKYYLTWVSWFEHGTTIGLAYTEDFKSWVQLENCCIPVSRNGVLFPRKINGNYMLLSRPCDKGHTPYGDVYLSQSPDLTYWGKHRHVISPASSFEYTKVGAGPTPIETDEGWLLFYHGVLTSCNGFVYSMSACILDKDEPWKVLHRSKSFLLAPWESYECVGDVPNVVFPCSALADADTGRITIYYGGADTVVAVAFTEINEVIKFIKDNDIIE